MNSQANDLIITMYGPKLTDSLLLGLENEYLFVEDSCKKITDEGLIRLISVGSQLIFSKNALV